jgi:hypothetical protein
VELEHGGEPLAIATGVAWFPLHRAPRGRDRSSLTALSDSRLMAFRANEVNAVLDLPSLEFAR